MMVRVREHSSQEGGTAHLDARTPLANDAALGIDARLHTRCITQPPCYRGAAEDGQQPSR